ncbi:MAG: hypothetical protein EPN30_05255 [Actinomycetota bacterium]|nr:MAG: hypothetical protein EPN30_05255 [Actinomycetota bacterium]
MGKKLTAWSLAALILAAILSACGSSTALSASTLSKVSARATTDPAVTVNVPWVDKPATIPTTTVVAPPLSATCKPADLKAGAASFGLATAQEGWRVPITNTGNQPCSLPDYLSTITAVGPDGSRVTLSNGPMIQPAPPITIPQGGKVAFGIISRAWCDTVGLVQPSEHYSFVEVGIPAGTLDLPNLNLKLCSNKIFSGFQEPISVPAPLPGTVASLAAHLDIPKSVKAGSRLDYEVVLENKSNETVNLNPCPVYQEVITVFVGMNGKSSSRTLELNCTTIKVIKPYQKITYEMMITVPSELGAAKFGWHIAPGGPYVGAALTIGQ